jgi:hypothetical protein
MKQLRADAIHGAHIIEWSDKRCRVLSVRPISRPGPHPRQRGSHQPAVLLSVRPIGRRRDAVEVLHYWADEMVTVVGWSIGQ